MPVQTVEIGQIVGLTREGEGVVHEGKTVFVAGALPGERVRYRIVRRRRRHAEAQLLEVLEAAPERATPPCPHFGVCGGCALQHLKPEAQLAAKDLELREALARIGRVQPQEWLAPLAGPLWGYRRRARLGAKFVTRKSRVVVGFRERLAPYVAELHSCAVLDPAVGELITPLAELLNSLSIRDRVPQIEVARADNAVALVLRTLAPLSSEDEGRVRSFAAERAVRIYLQPGGPDTVHELAPGGSEPLRYALANCGLELEFAPTDFVQINAAVNQALIERALELLQPTRSSVVLDLYCGLGNFTLPLAQRAGHVVGVEGEPALVARARHNAARNGLANTEFHIANLGETPEPTISWWKRRYTHVVLDPPRVGAQAVLGAIAAVRPQRLLYISCHPGSLARDLGVLVHDHGFELKVTGVLDMFPHTAHVESIALLGHPGASESSA